MSGNRHSINMQPNMHTPPRSDMDAMMDVQQDAHMRGNMMPLGQPVSTPVRPAVEFHDMKFQQTPNFFTPVQQPTWQLSPDVYNLNVGSLSAPASQLRNPWNNPIGDGQQLNLEAKSPMDQSQAWSQASTTFQPPIIASPLGASFWGADSVGGDLFNDPFTVASSFDSPVTGVNPNMIFSFSSPPHPANPGFSYSMPEQEARQPYEQQTNESLRERELAKKSRQNPQQLQPPHLQPQAPQTQQAQQQLQPPVLQQSRPIPTISTKPLLHRSNTDSGVRRNKARSTDSQSSHEHLPRKPSPLKRLSQASLTSIPEASRPSRTRTRLVVDETGTARTETFTDDETDRTNRRSISRWDDEYSSDEDPVMTSQRNSLVFPHNSMRPGKHLRDDEFEFIGQFKRPLSSASIGSLSSNGGPQPHQAADDTDEECGDAQDALRRLVGGRFRRGMHLDHRTTSNSADHSDPNATLKPRRAVTNPVQASSLMDITQFPSSSPIQPFANPSSINTPTTEGSTESNPCICGGSTDHALPVVQCEHCAKWAHLSCVMRMPAPPDNAFKTSSIFMCPFCRVQQSLLFAAPGAAYEDSRAGIAASPLGYKRGPLFG
jgi:hypothetical protein